MNKFSVETFFYCQLFPAPGNVLTIRTFSSPINSGRNFPFCRFPAAKAAKDSHGVNILFVKILRKMPKMIPPFFVEIWRKYRKNSPRRYVNQYCFHIRPGVSLHPSLAAPFLFYPVSVHFVHFAAIRCFVRKSEKSPDIITILFPILLRDTVRTCPNCSDIVTTLQIKCLIHFVRKKCVSTK